MIGLVGSDDRLPPVNLIVMISARLSARSVKWATPPETVAAVAPWSGPVPLLNIAVITVELSAVRTLLNWSSS